MGWKEHEESNDAAEPLVRSLQRNIFISDWEGPFGPCQPWLAREWSHKHTTAGTGVISAPGDFQSAWTDL